MRRTSLLSLVAVAGLALAALTTPAQTVEKSAKDTSDRKPAVIRVLLPSAAELTFDGFKTDQTGDVRRFSTPPLPPGQLFRYQSVKATWKSGGKDVVKETEARVQAGQEITIDLRDDKAREEKRTPDVVYWPTPQNVVDKMLEMAEVKKGDVVYDLGCGDARILVTAAKKFKVKGFGYDIDPARIKDSLENVKKNSVEELVTIKKADIFDLDLKDADVVTLYLLPDLNVKLMPQLAKLKPGSRIVSHDFEMKGAKPKKVHHMKATNHMGQEGEHTIYLWVVPWEKE